MRLESRTSAEMFLSHIAEHFNVHFFYVVMEIGNSKPPISIWNIAFLVIPIQFMANGCSCIVSHNRQTVITCCSRDSDTECLNESLPDLVVNVTLILMEFL